MKIATLFLTGMLSGLRILPAAAAETGNDAPVPAGMVLLPARGSVADAWARLEGAVAARGLTVFARIDFAAKAAGGCDTRMPGENYRAPRLLERPRALAGRGCAAKRAAEGRR